MDLKNRHEFEIEAYSISTLLKSIPISRGKLYQMWAEGTGPKTFRVGRKVLISRKAANEGVASLERIQSTSEAGPGK
ncbi:MAG: hypothetical protein PH343_03135 [Nitrospira sp.]|nr:hypothetical protein [Nitrospira sp.]